jgi:signal transduction histidine kinase
LLALGLALVASSVDALVYGRDDALMMLGTLGPIGAATILGVELLLRRRARLGGLRRQLSLVGAIAVGQLLVMVALYVGLMFVSPADAFFTAVVAVYAGVIAVCAARLLARRMLDDVDQLRGGLAAVAEGERSPAIAVDGGDELAELAREIEAMAARLASEEQARAAAESARRDLVASVSHDLRTPLTSLRLLCDALSDGVVDAARRQEYLTRIDTHVRALSGLIDDLFELSRLQAGEVRWTMERVPLADLLSETVDAMRPQAEARSIAMRAELASDLEVAEANPEQIQRVLFNLIQNALRHTPADGSVTVRAQAADGTVEIEVADTGQGIAESERERVFEAFFTGRGGEARSADAGTGLGLAISRAIVEAHGGRIWLADAARGTRIRFSIPR